MGRFSRVIVVTAIIAALLAACGSSAKPKSDNGKPLSKAEYIQRSDSICSSYNSRINSVVGAAGPGLTVSAYKDIFNEKLIPLFRSEHAELRALVPPKADAALIDKALLGMASGINTIEGRVGGAETIADLRAINPKGIARWKYAVGNYGMHVCGSAQK
jgi:hypothetical protein